jgi:uroporphyrinogen decarboxylase
VTESDEGEPDFSPDGRFVVYTSDESGRREVHIRRFPDGGGKVQVSTNGGGQPRWRGRGTELFYVEGETLMAVPVTVAPQLRVGQARRLFEHAGIARWPGQQYDVSADGARFVLIETVGGPPRPFAGVVQNWFAPFRDRGKGTRAMREPNFDNLRIALLRRGEPAYVPIMEFGVDYDVKCAFLGAPVKTLRDEVEFWYRAGYDFVPLQAGIRSLFWPGYAVSEKSTDRGLDTGYQLYRRTQTKFSVYQESERDMSWAEEGRGVITSLEEFEEFPWPDPDRMDLSAFEEIKQYLKPGMKVIAYLGYIFTSAWWLMGMETFCLALGEQPKLIRKLYDRIWAIQSRMLLRVLRCDVVGAVMHADDLAYADGLIVSPKHLRQYVFPWYRWCGSLVRDCDLPLIFHSDGKLDTVLEDVLSCGFNALHPIEPKAMDIAELKRKVGDRLCLIGNIDLGYTLTRGAPREVEAEVAERIRAIAPGGGYCVGSSNSVPAYVPLENFNAMREAAFRYGRYPIRA